MFIPSVSDVATAIQQVPYGATLTTAQMRSKLAQENGAETTCPFKVNQYWKWLAFAAENEGGLQLPWWRITKDGKPYDKLPGGASNHFARLQEER